MRNLVPINQQRGEQSLRIPSDPLDYSAGQPGAPKTGTEHTGIKEYFAIARRRWIIILVVVVASTGYTFNSVRSERAQYRSRATLRLVDASRALTGGMADRATVSDMPFSSGADPIQSQIQILQSEAVVSTAVDLKGLRLVPADEQSAFVPEITEAAVSENATADVVHLAFEQGGFSMRSAGKSASTQYGSAADIDGVRILVARRPRIPTTSFRVVSKEAAMSSILGSFRVSSRPKTDILDLAYTGFEANQTTRVANAMAEAYQLYNTSSAQQFSRRRRAFLEGQLKQTDSMLLKANSALGAFRAGRQNSVAAAAAQTNTFNQIQATRSQLESEKRSLETLLSKARESGRGNGSALSAMASSPTVLANPVINELFSQIVGLERVRDDLVNGGAAATNPDLITTNSRLAATQSRLVEAVESQRQSVDGRLQTLSRSGGGSAIATVVSEDTREAQLAQDVMAAQKLSTDIKEELQKAQMSEAVEAGQVEIVQLARNPGARVATGAERRLLLGLVVGLMFGFAAAVFVDNLDRRIRRRGDIEPLLGVPGLVVIPRLASAGASRSAVLRALPGRALKKSDPATNPTLDLVTITDPRSPSAEAFRTLRTNLMFSQAVSTMRLLVVTSASPGEGKTITASNLAVAFAQQGMRVLLVDCDLRRGRAHKIFGFAREPGMSDFALGYADEDAVTRPTAVGGLYVIPSGKFPPNPAELLGGEQMKRKLEAMTEGYDLVILDTPPLLAASDAAILATLADGVIMVLRAGSTEGTAAQQAMQQLHTLGARVVGAVLNDPESQVAKYGAYYEYNYSTTET